MQEILFSSRFQTFPGVKRGTQRVLKSSSKNPSYPNKQIPKRKLATKATGKKSKSGRRGFEERKSFLCLNQQT